MIVYNLTDRTPPWETKPRDPHPVKLLGQSIPSGGHADLGDFPLRKVSGLINAHIISVDGIPGWYREIGEELRQARIAKVVAMKSTSTTTAESDKSKKPRRRSDD